NFNELNISRYMRNFLHDKHWKEDESEILKITKCILDILAEIWKNPAFTTSTSCNQQSEGTYIMDVIIPLLQASLGDLPNGGICLSTSEQQSLESKARRNLATNENRIGKKPDVMGLSIQNEKILELIYTESS
ncbi:11739_t:CDS:2, partial [Entrophospora sp. SA101]